MPDTVTSCRLALVLALLGLSPAAAVAQQSSTNPYYEFLQARRLEGEGNGDAALAALQRAAAADPNSAEIKAELAGLYLRKTPPAKVEGEKALKEALAIDENNVEANRTLGTYIASSIETRSRTVTPQMAEDIKSAIGYLERAAAGTTGTDLQLQYTLGNLYLLNNEAPKAIQSLARVVLQNPGNPSARQALARAYAAADDLKGAIGTLQEVVDYIPNLAPDLATYQEQAGQLREAAASYTIALAVQPNNRQLKQRRILVLYNAKEYQQAAALAGEARKQHPDDLSFPRLQARALFDGGDRTAGIAVAEAAARSFPKDLPTQFALVDLYQDAGRPAEAEKLLRQMLSANPSSPQVLNHLGYMLATRGEQLDEAVSLVRRALDADPERPEYLDSLGWAYFKRGELNDAVKYLTAAAEKLPNHSEIQDHLGDVQARRGALQEAITAWTKALAGNGEGIERPVIERKLQDAKRKLPR
jgi:tetratricopeptide (TPR) repeat protein